MEGFEPSYYRFKSVASLVMGKLRSASRLRFQQELKILQHSKKVLNQFENYIYF